MKEKVCDCFLGDFVRKLCLQQAPGMADHSNIDLSTDWNNRNVISHFYPYLSTEDYKIHI